MTPQQQQALSAVAGRDLTSEEIAQIEPLLDPENRNDMAIAELLSVGRTRPVETEIGVGTILAMLRGVGAGGGAFLDALKEIGQQDRDVHWTMVLIEAGKLRIDMAPVRSGMAQLAQALPDLAAQIDILLTLGLAPDPIDVNLLSRTLNTAEGRENFGG